MMASDTLASYGSLARYKDMRRLKPVGDMTLIGASGEMRWVYVCICVGVGVWLYVCVVEDPMITR